MNKIIIDADPGVDDTFAILLAAKSKLIELLGITVVSGNCGLENGIRNTFKILDMCDNNHIPVYKGSEKSLVDREINASYVHGKNGFGNLDYEPISRSVSGDAVDYLINTVNANPKEITVVALGPLTNIATAIMRDNNFAKNIKSLVVMGGSKDEGNVTKYAEFNFYKDPHAAKIVFDSDIQDIKLFGLNVTHKLSLLDKYEDYLKNSSNKLANILYKITRIGAEFDRSCGFAGLILNDPLTVAYLINNDVVELENANINVVTDGEQIGKSIIDLKEDGRCKLACEVNTDLFYKILFQNLFEENF